MISRRCCKVSYALWRRQTKSRRDQTRAGPKLQTKWRGKRKYSNTFRIPAAVHLDGLDSGIFELLHTSCDSGADVFPFFLHLLQIVVTRALLAQGHHRYRRVLRVLAVENPTVTVVVPQARSARKCETKCESFVEETGVGLGAMTQVGNRKAWLGVSLFWNQFSRQVQPRIFFLYGGGTMTNSWRLQQTDSPWGLKCIPKSKPKIRLVPLTTERSSKHWP